MRERQANWLRALRAKEASLSNMNRLRGAETNQTHAQFRDQADLNQSIRMSDSSCSLKKNKKAARYDGLAARAGQDSYL
ncbi:uncharacterized protein TrAtP1_004769 [Trichoderma atroviride]|uniref:uncharacterized protein n=1 Tax=Hypocrea atroviridis TaxID=63577 RepID=UPI00331D976B|nr:hypothetical protein TrAtP1_004769 [Trichoderma atroviride]